MKCNNVLLIFIYLFFSFASSSHHGGDVAEGVVLFLALGSGLWMDVDAGKCTVWPHDQLVFHYSLALLDRGVGPLLTNPPSGTGVPLPHAAFRVASPG